VVGLEGFNGEMIENGSGGGQIAGEKAPRRKQGNYKGIGLGSMPPGQLDNVFTKFFKDISIRGWLEMAEPPSRIAP
jgi:hypothetical protein